MMSNLRCANCKEYLFHQPMQCPCGDRLCGSCHESYKSNNNTKIICPLCETEFLLEDCFRDRAATMELRKATLQCISPGCSWEGNSDYYKDHLQTCQFTVILCPHHQYGCKEQLPRSEMGVHEAKCAYMPVKCKWCKEKVRDEDLHLAKDCLLVPEFCANGCGEQITRKDMEKHIKTKCTHQLKDCEYKEEGCQFMGYAKDLAKHNKEQCVYHTQLMKQSFEKAEQSLDGKIKALTQQNSDLKSEVNQVRMEISMKLQPVIDAVVKAESAIQHLQEGFSEMALMVQTLQATSYDGVFIWKIPEIQRRRHEAKIGKTVSLYSAPFYTSRHGYKVCLRLYMDGDGSGKGTHLSFFVTVMRSEYDALLQWPFKQTVTLMLLDQDKLKDTVQSFRPEPTSSSFQRPRNEMNVASGCPMFAPLSILNNSSYVKDDTMFLKCKIETIGINAD